MTARKAKCVRVAFLTDSSFRRDNERMNGALKKRALRELQKRHKLPVYEDSTFPDIVFTVYRLPGSKSWCLRRKVERT